MFFCSNLFYSVIDQASIIVYNIVALWKDGWRRWPARIFKWLVFNITPFNNIIDFWRRSGNLPINLALWYKWKQISKLSTIFDYFLSYMLQKYTRAYLILSYGIATIHTTLMDAPTSIFFIHPCTHSWYCFIHFAKSIWRLFYIFIQLSYQGFMANMIGPRLLKGCCDVTNHHHGPFRTSCVLGPLLSTWINSIPARIINKINLKINNFIPHIVIDVITYPCWDLDLSMSVKRVPVVLLRNTIPIGEMGEALMICCGLVLSDKFIFWFFKCSHWIYGE